MRYPQFIKKGATIGLCAPSLGCNIEPYATRLSSAIKHFENLGFKIVETPHTRNNKKMESSDAKTRAMEFMSLYLNPDVDYIFSVGGGEIMVEILPYLDFDKLRDVPPKFFQGYSDNTNLTYTLTTHLDIATVYGPNFPEFGMSDWHESLKGNLKFMLGEKLTVNSFDKYEVDNLRKQPGKYLSSYNLTCQTNWINLSGEEEIQLSGRLIGGCLDILISLCGTKFDKTKEFIEKYQDDGIIWYLESCDLGVPGIIRALWQLKNAGWFKNASGFIIGRPLNKESVFDIDYKEAFYRHLKDLNVPVVIDADFGHVPPSFHIVSGALCKIKSKDSKGSIKYILE